MNTLDRINTHWYVLSGTTCAGKSSICTELLTRGYTTVPEITRSVFESLLKKGMSRKDIEVNDRNVRMAIFEHDRRLHHALSLLHDHLLFFDRGLPDQVAFFEASGISDTSAVLSLAAQIRYKGVFMLDPLPFVADPVRTNDEARRVKIHESLWRIYSKLGYDPFRIPIMSIADRTDTILGEIEVGCKPSTSEIAPDIIEIIMNDIDNINPDSLLAS